MSYCCGAQTMYKKLNIFYLINNSAMKALSLKIIVV